MLAGRAKHTSSCGTRETTICSSGPETLGDARGYGVEIPVCLAKSIGGPAGMELFICVRDIVGNYFPLVREGIPFEQRNALSFLGVWKGV